MIKERLRNARTHHIKIHSKSTRINPAKPRSLKGTGSAGLRFATHGRVTLRACIEPAAAIQKPALLRTESVLNGIGKGTVNHGLRGMGTGFLIHSY